MLSILRLQSPPNSSVQMRSLLPSEQRWSKRHILLMRFCVGENLSPCNLVFESVLFYCFSCICIPLVVANVYKVFFLTFCPPVGSPMHHKKTDFALRAFWIQCKYAQKLPLPSSKPIYITCFQLSVPVAIGVGKVGKQLANA